MDRYVQDLISAAKNMNRKMGCGISGENCSQGEGCPTRILYKAYKEVEARGTQHYLIYKYGNLDSAVRADSAIIAACRKNVRATFENSTGNPFNVNCKHCQKTDVFRNAMAGELGLSYEGV